MSGVLAAFHVAGLRMRQGMAGRLAWLVPVGFLVGWGAAAWTPGLDDSTRAALADRVTLGTIAALSVLVALVPAAVSFPRDLHTGAAHTLLAAPITRGAVIVGGVLGHGALATVLCVAASGAGLLGLEVGGLGAGAREQARLFDVVDIGAGVRVLNAAPTAEIAVALPSSAVTAGSTVLQLHPRPIYESGAFSRTVRCRVELAQPLARFVVSREVGFAPGRPFRVELPLAGADASQPAQLTIHRPEGSWGLLFEPGSIEIGRGPELFVRTTLTAAACLAPLLFLAAAAGVMGAARFSVPTALGVALALGLAFGGQDILSDASQFVLRANDLADAEARLHAGHDHGHDHGPTQVSAAQVLLAEAAAGVVKVLPDTDAFDRSGDVLARRAVPPRDVAQAAWVALPGLLLLTGLAWLLVRRRELLPT